MSIEGLETGIDPDRGWSGRGPEEGDVRSTSGVGTSEGSTTSDETLSVTGTTETETGLSAGWVDGTPPGSVVRKLIEASNQLINGLKRCSQLYPSTRSQGESNLVTYKSKEWTSPEGN